METVDGPSAGWRQLELTWTDGCLRLATENQEGWIRKEGQTREDSAVDQSALNLREQDDQANANIASSQTDQTTKASTAHEERALPSCITNKESLCSDNRRSAESSINQDEESGPDDQDQCSASVHEYLDSCFPATQSEQEQSELEAKRPIPVIPPLCTRTQYLATWTLSQSLILRGKHSIQSATSPEKMHPQTPTKHTQTPPSNSSSTPELFSPVPPSLGASAELFSQCCSTQRVEEGGIILEATTDGVLCSQNAGSTTLNSPTKSPDFKRARIAEDPRTKVPSNSSPAGLHWATIPLVQCNKPLVRYSILVVVVHPCHLKEIKVKSGSLAQTSVPLASIVVTDQSDVEMKVLLWRRAAFWVLTVGPGDILLITGLQVNEDKWRGETVLQSTFSSKLLNLGQVTVSTSPPGPRCVCARTLSALCVFLRERRPLLVRLPHRPPQDLKRLPYVTLTSLKVNTMVHVLLRVRHTHITWRTEADSCSRSAVQLKGVLTVEQPNGQQGVLLLWGAALEWLPRFKRDRTTVWDFRVLIVREGLTSDLPELHSTPWSCVQPLDPTDHRVQYFLPKCKQKGNGSSTLELDLDTLLSQRYSGEFLMVLVKQSGPLRSTCKLLHSMPLEDIVDVLSGDVTYTGCGHCCTELDTDTNGIYRPCYPCLPHTAVRRYYRPAVLTVSGQGRSQVRIQIPPVALQNILNAPPDKLHRVSAPGSQVKHIQVAVERIQSLLSLPRKTFIITINSNFLCDENSIPLYQDFTLLDFQFPS
uniref:Uncharacterized protein n=1 Tax=Echeneis naucrates TaxID=173247 RepID=A0A665U2X2_ECHNA